jgi:hypothetical protein
LTVAEISLLVTLTGWQDGVMNDCMAELLPAAPRRRPWLKYLGLSVLMVGLLSICWYVGSEIFLITKLAAPLIIPFFEGVPRITGTVVDAVTGQPIQGMDVCLVARAKWTNIYVDRSEITQSDASGKFSFAPSRQGGVAAAGYEIGIADPAAHVELSCGKYLEEAPYFNQLELPSRDDGKHFYFPMVAVPGLPTPLNDQVTYAWVTEKFPNPGNITIALIPLLKNESECAVIQDQTNASVCRYLNRSYDDALLRKRRQSTPNSR